MDLLSGSDREAGKVAVAGGDAMAMVHHDELAISALEVRESDYAVGRGDHGMPVSTADIHAAVKCAFPIEGIDALTETGGDLTIDRPEVGGGVSPEPVGCGGVARHT